LINSRNEKYQDIQREEGVIRKKERKKVLHTTWNDVQTEQRAYSKQSERISRQVR